MSGTALEGLLRRDRWVVAGALVVMTGLAWADILRLAAGMSAGTGMPGADTAGMDMSGMDMSGMDMSGGMGALAECQPQPWIVADFGFTLAMWAVMMVGMMTPSVAPMILIYARVARQAAERRQPFAASLWFVAGYLLVWFGFSLAATGAQWGLESLKLMTPAMASAGRGLAGGLLVAVGLYQWTPWKHACLAQCQAPLAFLQRQGGFSRTVLGSLRLGARHGAYCVGCCWALMALLFVGGVMNILWIAAMTIIVLLEKLAPAGSVIAQVAGAVCIVAGTWLLVTLGG